MEDFRLIDLEPIPPDEKEVMRYALLPPGAPVPEDWPYEECAALVRGRIRCRAVWRRLPVRSTASGIAAGPVETSSAALRRHLEGCDSAVLFACTAGFEMDRLIARGKRLSPAHALILHAIGAQQVEEACDRLCRMIAEENRDMILTDRFSPGYGDLPLRIQKSILEALNAEKLIGIHLSDACVMTPSKSVTAFTGLKERK